MITELLSVMSIAPSLLSMHENIPWISSDCHLNVRLLRAREAIVKKD